MMFDSRRRFLQGLLSIGVGYAFLSEKFIKLSSLVEVDTFKNFLVSSGLEHFMRSPSENLSQKFAAKSSESFSADLLVSLSDIELSQAKVSQRLAQSMTQALQSQLSRTMSDQDYEQIVDFFNTEVGQKFVSCLKSIPYDAQVNQMTKDFWALSAKGNANV